MKNIVLIFLILFSITTTAQSKKIVVIRGSGGTTDTSSLSNRINQKLNITDTANIRLRPIAGTNTTITGTYPNLTFNSTGGAAGWSLTGNAGTDTAVNFIGTTDAKSFIIKTKGIKAAFFDTLGVFKVGNYMVNDVSFVPNIKGYFNGGIYSSNINGGYGMYLDSNSLFGNIGFSGNNPRLTAQSGGWLSNASLAASTGVYAPLGQFDNIVLNQNGSRLRSEANDKAIILQGGLNGGGGASITVNGATVATEGGEINIQTGNSTGSVVRIGINNVEKVRLSNAGNLLIGTITDIPSSKLTVESTTQGVLLPRMTTTQINAIASPANGLLVYNTTLNTFCFWNGTTWQKVTTTAM